MSQSHEGVTSGEIPQTHEEKVELSDVASTTGGTVKNEPEDEAAETSEQLMIDNPVASAVDP